MKDSSTNRFLQPEVQGKVNVRFDKTGYTKSEPLDRDDRDKKVRDRLETLKVTFPMFQCFVSRELNWGNIVEALAFYQAVTLRPLVELLRINTLPTAATFIHDTCTTTCRPALRDAWRGFSSLLVLANSRKRGSKRSSGCKTYPPS